MVFDCVFEKKMKKMLQLHRGKIFCVHRGTQEKLPSGYTEEEYIPCLCVNIITQRWNLSITTQRNIIKKTCNYYTKKVSNIMDDIVKNRIH